MDGELDYMMELLCCVIQQSQAPVAPSSMDWVRFYREALSQNVAGLLYSAVKQMSSDNGPSEDIRLAWRNHAVTVAMGQMTYASTLAQIIEECRKIDIEPVMFKGLILADLYPEPMLRWMGDVDLLIKPEEETALFTILRAFQCNETSVPQDHKYEHSYTLKNGVHLEVHTRLWEEKEDHPRLAALKEMNITAPENVITMTLNNITVSSLGYHQHLLYMLYHIVKHFIVQGIGVRHLIDLTLYYNAYKDRIDVPLLWRQIETLGYGEYYRYIFAICIKRFAMNEEIFPAYVTCDADLEQKIISDIWMGGVFGKRTIARELSGRFLRQYYENSTKKLPKNRIHLLLSFLFPVPEELTRIDFVDLSENRFIAWFQRMRYLLSRWYTKKKQKEPTCSLQERMECSLSRLEIMQQAGLLGSSGRREKAAAGKG